MRDLIDRQAAIDALRGLPTWWEDSGGYYGVPQPPMEALLDPNDAISSIENLPSAQLEDYTEMKREFLRMASYIDVLLECSDKQKETLLGFISRMSEFMPWNERD